ncbi:hypothetical protein [Streptomyces vinaceus]|uniref:hypothetical protein n=1 Tax=Streptomyces vinaceus TaxID=1960 RepID=UPI003811DDC4
MSRAPDRPLRANRAADRRGPGGVRGGRPGLVSWREGGTPLSILACTVTDGWITAITAVGDPARLARMDLPDQA